MNAVERVALAIYEADGFMVAMYSSAAESWAADREGVRGSYRTRAIAATDACRRFDEEQIRTCSDADFLKMVDGLRRLRRGAKR